MTPLQAGHALLTVIPPQALFGQLLIGLINGSFYALLSLGLSVIFGLLNIINFTHGAQYMMGAFVAYFLLTWAGLGYWWALLIAPLAVGALGIAHRAHDAAAPHKLDHLYGLLLTFGSPWSSRDCSATSSARRVFRTRSRPAPGGQNLGFMFLPNYRAWVIGFSLIVCLATWYVIERTRLGAYLRAATENPPWCRPSGSMSRA